MPRTFALPRSRTTPTWVAILIAALSNPTSGPASGSEPTPPPRPPETGTFHFPGLSPHPWHGTRPGGATPRLAAGSDPTHVELTLRSPKGRTVRFTDRVVVRFPSGRTLPAGLLANHRLHLERELEPGLWIFQAPDAWSAAVAADALGGLPGVELAAPVIRRDAALQGPFAPRPNDPYFPEQWHLENRDLGGQPLGPDTRPRGAWAVTRGEGVAIAVCDNGFETSHPDLAAAAAGQPHFDFTRNQAGSPVYGAHATCVAGLAAATGDNAVGATGVAPAASLVSTPIFNTAGGIATDERLFDAYRHRNQEIAVQNHSWANSDLTLAPPGPLEAAGMSNAVTAGRNGLGVVIVRAAGNYREDLYDANYDGSANDPRVITVAAVRQDGRAASYSNPGACILVGAPSGDDDDPFQPTANLFTTDQVGSRGYNGTGAGDLPNYTFGTRGFWGTSAATPQISGVAALVLSAQPGLHRRDVQQILLHAARHPGAADPTLRLNGAGYPISDNLGFGVPDAGQAVALARAWSNRPPLTIARFLATNLLLQIPNDGLRVFATGPDAIRRSIACQPALGPHPDEPTEELPLVDVGRATTTLTTNLAGKAALIQRGDGFFRDKILRAADAGAAFVVLHNHLNGDEIFVPEGTDFTPVPAVMISQNEGRTLVSRLAAGEEVRARLNLDAAQHDFLVPDTLVCEHVGLRVRASHDRRGDLRITLVSPSGTRSVLQRLNQDTEPGPDNWTYWSVQHFYEPSAGLWRVTIADEAASLRGSITELELIVHGVPIADTDADGLDDAWEMAAFGSLAEGPADDPDGDGSTNAREQALRRDPTRPDKPLRLDLASYDGRQLLRLSWPGTEGTEYRLLQAPSAGGPSTEVTRIRGVFPETEAIVPFYSTTNQLFWLAAPPP